MTGLRLLGGLGALLLSLGARAQEAAPALPEDPRAPRFREIERGVFAGVEAGWTGLFKTPTADPGKYPSAGSDGGFSSGLHLAITVGADLSDRLALSLVLLGVNQQASISYGSFSLFGAGADARFAVVRWPDSQGVERIYLYVHGRGAFVASDPRGLFGTTDAVVAAGAGLEYYTRLRHFSLGLLVDGVFAVKAAAPGIAIVPTLRYTF